MKRMIRASLEPDFSWGKYYYARKQGKRPKFYKSNNADMHDAEEIDPDEYFEVSEKYANIMFGG